MDGIRPLAPSLDTLGFFVRDLQDVPPLFAALAGAPPRPMPAPPAMPRFALCRTDRWEKAEPSTRAAVEDCAARLHAFELDLGTGFAGLVDAQIAIMGAEAAISLQNEQPISARLREFLDAGRACSPERLRTARDQAERCRREFDQLAGRYDAVITPAAPGEAPIGLESTGDPAFSRIWTLLGAPSFSLPILTGPAGLPLGLQLVGGRGSDEALLAAAAWVLTTAR